MHLRLEAVEHGDLVVARNQGIHEVRPEITRAACNENLPNAHARRFMCEYGEGPFQTHRSVARNGNRRESTVARRAIRLSRSCEMPTAPSKDDAVNNRQDRRSRPSSAR